MGFRKGGVQDSGLWATLGFGSSHTLDLDSFRFPIIFLLYGASETALGMMPSSFGRVASIGRQPRPHLLRLQEKASASVSAAAAAAAAASRSILLHQPFSSDCGDQRRQPTTTTSACSAASGPCSPATSTSQSNAHSPMQSTAQAASASTGSPSSASPAAASHYLAASRRLCSHVKVCRGRRDPHARPAPHPHASGVDRKDPRDLSFPPTPACMQ